MATQKGQSGELKPRVLRLRVEEQDAGKTIKDYLMKKIGFSSKQLSRFKYRKDGILLNGEKRYVNAPLQEGDVLEIRLTQGGEPVEEHPHDALRRSGRDAALSSGPAGKQDLRSDERQGADLPGLTAGYLTGRDGRQRRDGAGQAAGYLAARDGRLQKIWAPPAPWLNEKYPFRILYEDEDILAADKPSGVVCHPSPGHFDDTLSNQVAEHLGRIGQELDVRVTGRLDRDTSGIVIFALNTETAAQLIKQRQASMMQKLYIARVRGHFSKDCGTDHRREAGTEGRTWCHTDHSRETGAEGRLDHGGDPGKAVAEGVVDRPLRRESRESFRMIIAEDGKTARTHYRVLAELEDGTCLAACRIEHGRTHQIRVHMASLGHPIVGDRLYGPEAGETELQKPGTVCTPRRGRAVQAGDQKEEKMNVPPLMLHAYRAVLRQPFTGEEIRLEAPLPEWADGLCPLPVTL